MVVKTLFWFSICFIVYAYFGYPVLLFILSKVRNSPVKKGDFQPKVSFIITAYNEEKTIREKLENTLNQDYPQERFEIIVASDCSTDQTENIVKAYMPKGVNLVRSAERRGKENAQKCGVKIATGEILIFSDVATILQKDGVRKIIRNFNDPTIGCVSSEDRFVDPDGKVSGEGAYVRYEMFLRKMETRVNTLVGLSGSFFAARREVCNNWADDLQSDFNTLLNSIKMGLRGVSDPESIGYYENISDERKEFARKGRTVLRGITVISKNMELLNPFRYGLFAWQLLSHKLCRWLIPFAMILAIISNVILSVHGDFYFYLLILQISFYSLAVTGIGTVKYFSQKTIFRIPSFLILVNISILKAWYKFVSGERVMVWEPSQRRELAKIKDPELKP